MLIKRELCALAPSALAGIEPYFLVYVFTKNSLIEKHQKVIFGDIFLYTCNANGQMIFLNKQNICICFPNYYFLTVVYSNPTESSRIVLQIALNGTVRM